MNERNRNLERCQNVCQPLIKTNGNCCCALSWRTNIATQSHTVKSVLTFPLQTSAGPFQSGDAFYGAAAKLRIALDHRLETALCDGFHHVTGSSPQAVHQLYDGGQRGDQERLQAEPVGPQEQLHPQEEHQQEEESPLWWSEGSRLVAQILPGRAEEGKVGDIFRFCYYCVITVLLCPCSFCKGQRECFQSS